MKAHASYVNSCTGLSLNPTDLARLLEKMTLNASVSTSEKDDVVDVNIPPTRPDIMHECDLMEDAAIAYGFNNLPDTFPPTSTVAQPLAISKLTDIVRREWALAGFVEVFPFILVRFLRISSPPLSSLVFFQCSHEENFDWLNRTDDSTQVVRIGNPKTLEFQVVRTSLLPGLLKTIRENRSHALPIKIFDISDIVFKDASRERQARNVRHAAAVWCNKTAGFEVVHGMLDRMMQMLEVPRIEAADEKAATGYYIKEREGTIITMLPYETYLLNDMLHNTDPTFFPGRAATVYYRPPPSSPSFDSPAQASLTTAARTTSDKEIGLLGILHPTVLEKFEITYPCSALELSLEPFKREMHGIWTDA